MSFILSQNSKTFSHHLDFKTKWLPDGQNIYSLPQKQDTARPRSPSIQAVLGHLFCEGLLLCNFQENLNDGTIEIV